MTAQTVTETKPMTCIICPMGCNMEITLETSSENGVSSTKVVKVTDNNCPRGAEYAKKELLNPTRILTTTVAVKDGTLPVVPVKSAGEVPKNMLMQCMEVIRRAVCTAPVKRGDILVYDILGTGVNIIACADVPKV